MSTDVRLCKCGCRTVLTRRRYPNGQLEAPGAFSAREYDGHACVGRARSQGLTRTAGAAQEPRKVAKGVPVRKTSSKRSQGHTAPHTGLGPLQPFAFNSPNPKRHDLIAERQAAEPRPEPSDGEIMALLKVCLELHEPLLECFEEAAQAARPVRRVPRAGTSRARWQA